MCFSRIHEDNDSSMKGDYQLDSFHNITAHFHISYWKWLGWWTYIISYWGRDKIAAISETACSNAFSWMKMMELRFKFAEICSQESNQQYPSIGSDNGLAPSRRQAIIWTNDGYFTDAYLRHSASMSFNGSWWKNSFSNDSCFGINVIFNLENVSSSCVALASI